MGPAHTSPDVPGRRPDSGDRGSDERKRAHDDRRALRQGTQRPTSSDRCLPRASNGGPVGEHRFPAEQRVHGALAPTIAPRHNSASTSEEAVMRSVVLVCLVALTSAAWAQPYPVKPIRVLVGYAPGGSADAGIRPLAKVLEPLLGQPLVIEYRPGNAGGVAMEAIARAPADGYTLYYFDSGPLTAPPPPPKAGSGSLKSLPQPALVSGRGSLSAALPLPPFRPVQAVFAPPRKEPPN